MPAQVPVQVAPVAASPPAPDGLGQAAPADGTYVVTIGYAANEMNADGDPEQGYVALAVGDRVTLLSEAMPGHPANQHQRYAYGQLLSGETGWVPVDCLSPS